MFCDARCPFRQSCASISNNVSAWQLGETLRQIGAGMAVRSARHDTGSTPHP
jgi:hypothetical protein